MLQNSLWFLKYLNLLVSLDSGMEFYDLRKTEDKSLDTGSGCTRRQRCMSQTVAASMEFPPKQKPFSSSLKLSPCAIQLRIQFHRLKNIILSITFTGAKISVLTVTWALIVTNPGMWIESGAISSDINWMGSLSLPQFVHEVLLALIFFFDTLKIENRIFFQTKIDAN